MLDNTHFLNKIKEIQNRVENNLQTYLASSAEPPNKLHSAMRYACLGGGKRVRPLLVYATGEALGIDQSELDYLAAAVECIHVYSLVHDDLPSMDNDDLRRGRPTCHIEFDEATALLVGDGLQTLAFELLADNPSRLEPEKKLLMIKALARASGSRGMVGGQAIDLESVGHTLSREALEVMHSLKTGALIRASVELATLGSNELSSVQRDSLLKYAECIGLAFQVRDDILDIEGDTQTLGKTQGSDIDKNKPTYPALLGLEGAKKIAQELHLQALECLSSLDNKADTLRALSGYIVDRQN